MNQRNQNTSNQHRKLMLVFKELPYIYSLPQTSFMKQVRQKRSTKLKIKDFDLKYPPNNILNLENKIFRNQLVSSTYWRKCFVMTIWFLFGQSLDKSLDCQTVTKPKHTTTTNILSCQQVAPLSNPLTHCNPPREPLTSGSDSRCCRCSRG